jgi:hypothetical protein
MYVVPRSIPAPFLQQSRFPQGCQKILLYPGKRFTHNGLASNQHQVHGLRQLMLMQAKAFAQESTGAQLRRRVCPP